MIEDFLNKTIISISELDISEIDKAIEILKDLKGRLFIIGSGGGAGHASHAVCDFRKLCEIEAYAPYDNVSELTARTNDEGFDTTVIKWLEVSNLSKNDCIMVISVGGGNKKLGVSTNLCKALVYARLEGAKIIGIVGRDGGMTKELADACILIKTDKYTTPITEGIQAVVWHLLVTKLTKNKTKW